MVRGCAWPSRAVGAHPLGADDLGWHLGLGVGDGGVVRVEAVQQVRLLAEDTVILLNELLSYLRVHTRSVGQGGCECGEAQR